MISSEPKQEKPTAQPSTFIRKRNYVHKASRIFNETPRGESEWGNLCERANGFRNPVDDGSFLFTPYVSGIWLDWSTLLRVGFFFVLLGFFLGGVGSGDCRWYCFVTIVCISCMCILGWWFVLYLDLHFVYIPIVK